jgi:hypothetical protein
VGARTGAPELGDTRSFDLQRADHCVREDWYSKNLNKQWTRNKG